MTVIVATEPVLIDGFLDVNGLGFQVWSHRDGATTLVLLDGYGRTPGTTLELTPGTSARVHDAIVRARAVTTHVPVEPR